MKFSSIIAFPLAALAAVSSVVGTATPTKKGVDIIKARQFNPRGLVDICAALDVDLDIKLGQKDVIVGRLDVCLCLEALPNFLEAHVVAAAAVKLVGADVVSAKINALLNAAHNKKSCTYPQHYKAICSSDDPCGWDCTDGFTAYPATKPTQCICPTGKTVCNGKCGDFSHGCASPVPKSGKRTLNRLEY
ncbi:hypothetical protein BD626DRAFT_633577 [Schizophyllum amplum]|uniref:Uncharacterized protein n=1 Tax=Schizophyllum amplum TaxID=97359 RepID=A0A550C2J6_9AGAR|nr:hypothetical protein BD626DRAFT_633577 [Auriculariopsis ampla]